ncbi:hypothetical protein LPJ63_000424 [Coemansia sp. RSA 2711]|nr:hypothetical protein LPJ63_000424 [Coemansia sp. RSA 2711]KAJ2718306.1 hypothetical protein H4R23_005048 [Coemansia sp. Cherry 401B]
MRLRSKNASIHSIAEDDISFVPVWSDIPRNPVFYPPTYTESLAIPKPSATSNVTATSDSKPVRLLTRLRAMLLPKAAGSPESRRAQDSRDHQQAPQRFSTPSNAHKLANRPPRLEARSAVREDSISPDLFALADLGFASRTKSRKLTELPPVLRRPTESHADAKRRRQHRAALTASVYLPPSSQPSTRHFTLPANSHFADLTHLFESEPLPSTPHSDDTVRTAVPPLPVQSADEPDEYACTHRNSNSSDSTAILSPAVPEPSTTKHRAASTLSGGSQAPRISYSPSQRTLSAADCDCAYDHAGFMCAEHFLEMLTAQGLDAVESHESGRRPYSESFSEHAHISGSSTGRSDGFVEHVALARSYRAMHIRTSCADAELVKTTFDLAKLLPNTPQ